MAGTIRAWESAGSGNRLWPCQGLECLVGNILFDSERKYIH